MTVESERVGKAAPSRDRRGWSNAVSWLTTILLALGLFSLTRFFGLGLYVITTDSMKPTLQPRDFVAAVAPRWNTPHVGSMVVFAPEFAGTPLPRHVHRIVGTYPDGTWMTRGDNAASQDPWHVKPGQVTGVVQGVVLPAGLTQNAWIVGVGTALLALYILWPSSEEDRERSIPRLRHSAAAPFRVPRT